MSSNLADETAVVTGAAQGIGRAIARELGEAGANVVIADVQPEVAAETAAELEADGIAAESIVCDVTEVADCESLVAGTEEAFGSLDILVNNAGISTHGTFTDLQPDDWNEVIDVNLTGAFNCSYAAIPAMIGSGGGAVVNVSSMAGRGISYHAAANYTASKWGLIGLTKHMAWDLGGDGIRVNALCPGSTKTPLIEAGTDPDGRAETAEKIPLERWATPEDQARAVRYLVSEESSYVTGTVLEVDGGKQLGVRHEI